MLFYTTSISGGYTQQCALFVHVFLEHCMRHQRNTYKEWSAAFLPRTCQSKAINSFNVFIIVAIIDLL